jgi:superfamily II DNA helicase RecQ
VLGEARLTLAQQKETSDVIVIDAFSSDAIPMHLLTREALGLYLSKLAPHGALVMHITNKYVELTDLVARIGAEHGLVPHSSATTQAQRDEEARLLYVACTRAREQLVISWAALRNGRACQPSALIADIGPDTDAAVVPSPIPRLPRPAVDPVYAALVAWRAAAAKAAQVSPSSICSDASLRAVAKARPTTVDEIVLVANLGPVSGARIAPRMLNALTQAL